MKLIKYSSDLFDDWNNLVENSKNGTFLINRNFMDYHSSRFLDCSLLFYHKNKLIACLPANYNKNENIVYSHQGLTYGGLIMNKNICISQVLDIFSIAIDYYKHTYKANSLIYKPTPHIYHKYPSEEDLYALYVNEAKLHTRSISSTIPLKSAIIPMTESRKSGLRKAKRANLTIDESEDINSFWNILNETLNKNHSVSPVHSSTELQLLKERFPEKIKLFTVTDAECNILAGTLIFDCDKTIHTQYIAANDRGKSVGALDYLLNEIINNQYKNCVFFDFGVSTENGGLYLNNGLIFQKEGFGGRGISYDSWIINLRNS